MSEQSLPKSFSKTARYRVTVSRVVKQGRAILRPMASYEIKGSVASEIREFLLTAEKLSDAAN